MQSQIEKQTIPTAQAIFAQGLDGRSPEVKRCGYCDRLVRWTIVEGRNMAVNCAGSRHQCLTDGTAKRREPVKHARPSPIEVAGFLASGQADTRKSQQKQGSPDHIHDPEIEAIPKANVAAWKEKTEAMSRLADAMLKVAQSNNALAESNRRLAKTYGLLARAMERAGQPHR